jgi:osmotically-inducible protein OsmY
MEEPTMKTDQQLRNDVLEQLRWEPSIHETEVATSVKDGVVTLSGYVDSFAEKYAAVRAIERLNGVVAVVDNLEVNLPSAHKRPDTDIAHAAVTALKWDITVPDDRIKMTVRDGWITLEGDVMWQYQKTAAERAVRNLIGVKGVTNLIALHPPKASVFDVSAKIKDALRRTAELDADRITVVARDGAVTLRGTVHSYAERRGAERAAWSAPGVSKVDDRIAVAF